MAGHDHGHDDDHEHREHGSELSETQLRVRALESIVTEKGYVDPAALDAIVETQAIAARPACWPQRPPSFFAKVFVWKIR